MLHARLTSFVWCLVFTAGVVAAARPDGTLEISATDASTQRPMAVRMELTRADGKPLRQRGLGLAPLGNHFYIDGRLELGLRRGQYRFKLDAGPEYKPVSGHFEIERHAADAKSVEMHRVVNLTNEAWFGADLLAQRKDEGLGVALRAEALALSPLAGWTRDGDKWEKGKTTQPAEGFEDLLFRGCARYRDASGDLAIYRADGPITEDDIKLIGDASVLELRQAQKAGLIVIAADPTSWRMPIWLAAGVLDGMIVVGPSGEAEPKRRKKPWGRPRDTTLFPGSKGAARWREAIYFHTLNAGYKLPPLAGSGSGDNESPLGAARAYAKVAGGFSSDEWWRSALAGELFVTNGPLLRPMPVPGGVLRLPASAPSLTPALNLTTRQTIEYLEIIKNGRVDQTVPIRDLVASRGQLPPIDCSGSGWFLIRAVAGRASGYHRAMTAPYYFIDSDGAQRISKKSCEFFLSWLDEAQEKAAEKELKAAKTVWGRRLAQATDD